MECNALHKMIAVTVTCNFCQYRNKETIFCCIVHRYATEILQNALVFFKVDISNKKH